VTDDIPHDLNTALAERYELRHTLGRGGMATVYLAYDRKYQREVAVKVLRPDLAATLGAERFLAEIQIVARLTHPHILALYESGEASGFLYYVMPHLTGRSLRHRLEQRRRLAPDEALAIAAPVADALSYAHRMGVLHRDIKPENILFSEGHPIVADFGIAKAVSTAGGANLTRTGFPLGTPGYMSPEQAAGLTDLDVRSDVYSLAAVIYEMLVGEAPGRWPTEEATRTGRFLEAPAAHRTRLAEVGSVIEGALVRGLSTRHDLRTETPEALMAELAGVAAPPRRHYREEEIREIVRRATELEASNPTGGAMTIGGVEALAAEVGVTPALVRQAAQSLRTADTPAEPLPPSGWSKVINGPTAYMFDRMVEGELPESEFPVMVDEIRREIRHAGQVSQLGRSFSWTVSPTPGLRRDVEVSVSVRGGRTRITVRENMGPIIGPIFGGICGGVGGGGMGAVMGITMGALGLPPITLAAIVPVWLTGVFVTARTIYGNTSRSRVQECRRVLDRLAALAEELIAERPRLPAAAKALPGRGP